MKNIISNNKNDNERPQRITKSRMPSMVPSWFSRKDLNNKQTSTRAIAVKKKASTKKSTTIVANKFWKSPTKLLSRKNKKRTSLLQLEDERQPQLLLLDEQQQRQQLRQRRQQQIKQQLQLAQEASSRRSSIPRYIEVPTIINHRHYLQSYSTETSSTSIGSFSSSGSSFDSLEQLVTHHEYYYYPHHLSQCRIDHGEHTQQQREAVETELNTSLQQQQQPKIINHNDSENHDYHDNYFLQTSRRNMQPMTISIKSIQSSSSSSLFSWMLFGYKYLLLPGFCIAVCFFYRYAVLYCIDQFLSN